MFFIRFSFLRVRLYIINGRFNYCVHIHDHPWKHGFDVVVVVVVVTVVFIIIVVIVVIVIIVVAVVDPRFLMDVSHFSNMFVLHCPTLIIN